MARKKRIKGHRITISREYFEGENLWKLISSVLALLLFASIVTNGFGFGNGTGSGTCPSPKALQPADDGPREVAPTQPTRATQPSAPARVADVGVDDDSIKGSEDAPVTIIEFSDYECPFCTRFYTQTLPLIEEEYIETGKVRFVYRDFPLGFHRNAQKAAEAAECAGEQGKYFEMHDVLFDEGVKGGVESYKRFAADIGLNLEEFNDCLDSDSMADEVQKDLADGQAAGVRGTPGFLINGVSVRGAQPFENFKKIIDEELEKAGQ